MQRPPIAPPPLPLPPPLTLQVRNCRHAYGSNLGLVKNERMDEKTLKRLVTHR